MRQNTENSVIDNSSWFRHWFDSSFYHKLYTNRNEQEAADFINELVAEIKPQPGARMLDLGCGNGRHSKRLASKGFRVTGLDIAASNIRAAKKLETDLAQFYTHDMRVPFGKNCFDYVFSFFTSFGYFKSDHENYQVVNNISSSLVHDGVCVMDYLNVNLAEQNLVAAETNEIDGIIYRINRWSDEKFFFKKIIIETVHQHQPIEFVEQVSKFSVAEFDSMFKRSGLRIQKLFGDYSLNEYDIDTSPRLIMVAKKI